MSKDKMMITEMEFLEKLQEVLEVQCSNGNWNFDPYMHGLANGLILAESIALGTDPVFLQPPDKWLANMPEKKIETDEVIRGKNQP